ncbi:hypothetical protein G2W53_008549 [Senna tora]|uniref:Uncharacterized protein n=1 Tax=Senna tora TaxID=362788 RepID=A0A834X996_9FABA|nr:hypothetical protein G2W53_008549 [Senna tora]
MLACREYIESEESDTNADQDQESEMQSPISLELTEIALRRLLVVNLELIVRNGVVFASAALDLHLDFPELLGGQGEGELVASALVLEAVDASEGLRDGDVEDEVREGEEGDRDPAMAALEARGMGMGDENEGEEDEEDLEELVELLLLKIDGSFLLQSLLEVELDYGVQGLECRLLRVVVGMGFVVRHGREGKGGFGLEEKKKKNVGDFCFLVGG